MATFVCRTAFFATLSVNSLAPVEANVFLGRELPQLRMNVGDLLQDLEAVLGVEHREKAEARAVLLEDVLRPTWKALPKSNDDLLEPTAVRYLLHRYFVDRHGWFVAGFDTEGEAWNSSSASSVFAEHAPGAQDMFEKRMQARGLPLHEVALLAATLESLVHAETVQRLHTAYSLLHLSKVEAHASESEVLNALDMYMVLYVHGSDPNTVTKDEVDELLARINEFYPGWGETKKWVREVRKEILAETPEDRTSFDATVRVVESMADRYGRWQDRECHEVKDELLKIERPGTGRVPVSSFYQAALNGAWQFSESVAYLKHLGVLDESDSLRPSIMIPNYVNAPTNCLSSSKFYSVCCINECEALLGHVEKQIAAPSASVDRILEVVQKLPSSTEDAPRVLSQQLVKRLQEIADHHGGVVPFHARLFNQWLHHVYPRECPYPHLSGTVKIISPEAFIEKTGMSDWVDETELRTHALTLGQESDFILNEELPWTADEECFIGQGPVVKPQPQEPEVVSSKSGLRSLMMCVAAGSVVISLFRMLTQAKTALSITDLKDSFV